jgi:hypothetical protein
MKKVVFGRPEVVCANAMARAVLPDTTFFILAHY